MRWVISGLILILCLFVFSIFTAPGCSEPPVNTVQVPGGLAWDDDQDGEPDRDAEGNVKFIPGSQAYRPAAAADSILPTILTAAGGFFGIPLLTGIGWAWAKHKYGRVLVNTVMTIQNARKELIKGRQMKALEIVMDELGKQLPETKKMIADLKLKNGVASVPKP